MATIFTALDGSYEQFQEKFGVKIRLDTQERVTKQLNNLQGYFKKPQKISC